MSTLQTLDRGLRALFAVARHSGGITVAELANELELARPIAYRLVATLETHDLLTRDSAGQLFLGTGVAALMSHYRHGLIAQARPILQELADATGATASLAVAERDEAVVILTLEPRHSGVLRVGYRVGSRHPLSLGATGIAILAGRPERSGESADVAAARDRGYSVTRGHLESGAVGVAAPLRLGATVDASIGIVALQDFDDASAAPQVLAAAARIVGAVSHP